MNNKIINVIAFAAGAAIGSLVTWKVVQTRYEQNMQKEIDSVKETFARYAREEAEAESVACDENQNEVREGDEDSIESPYTDEQDRMMDLFEQEALLKRLKYTTASENQEEGGGEPVPCAPYVISPDDFGDVDGYETANLTYYSDGVVEDDYWNVVENVDDVIGDDFMNHFDEYAEATVFIRNESLKTDYEITKDKRTYAESQAYSPTRQ